MSETKQRAQPDFVPHFLWSGSLETEKNLSERFQFTLDMPASGLGFRVQYTDRRRAKTWETFAESFSGDPKTLSALSGAVYHKSTGSRFLYGMLSTSGLAARIKNPWIRGSPFTENHVPSQSDLKTESSSTALPALYLYLGSPDLAVNVHQDEKQAKLKLFGAFSFESEGEKGSTFSFSGGKPAFTSGADISFSGAQVHLESYFTEGTIPPRKASAWFSKEPALPERDFRVYAGSFVLNLPNFGFAADGAYSQTFAYGEGFYGNASLRFGNRPWRFLLAADGSGSRYTGPDGGESGAGFRLAARLERRGKRSSLLRFDALYRSNETDNSEGDFWEQAARPNRYSVGAYYRFPVEKSFFSFSRVSFKASADKRETKKDHARVEALIGVRLRQIHSDTQLKLSGFAYKDENAYSYESCAVRESLLWNNDFLQFRTALGYTAPANKKNVWDTSLSAALKLKRGWVKLQFDSPHFPEKHSLTLSWLGKW